MVLQFLKLITKLTQCNRLPYNSWTIQEINSPNCRLKEVTRKNIRGQIHTYQLRTYQGGQF